MNFTVSTIYARERSSMEKVDALLAQEQIRRDKNLDLTLGIFDGERLIATGSSYKNTLRCFAVDKNYQGYALMNLLVSELLNRQTDLGYDSTFVYTKNETVKFFESLGFYPIAQTDRLTFLENRKQRFEKYLAALQSESESFNISDDMNISAIVMNANPFTLGHLYLVEQAAAESDFVHLFAVSDDSSLVPFSLRSRLIREGTKHLKNIIHHQTDSYMISQAIFPSYFLQEENDIICQQAQLDIEVFSKIAHALAIRTRYIGSEPLSRVTNLYNQVMEKALPPKGIAVRIIPRKEENGLAISASRVRKYIHAGELEKIRTLVPQTTYDFFCSEEAKAIIEKIRLEKNVVHY